MLKDTQGSRLGTPEHQRWVSSAIYHTGTEGMGVPVCVLHVYLCVLMSGGGVACPLLSENSWIWAKLTVQFTLLEKPSKQRPICWRQSRCPVFGNQKAALFLTRGDLRGFTQHAAESASSTPFRLSHQRDGCLGPAAIPHAPEHCDALEGQA